MWLGIPINDRRCTLCNSRQIADEMRFILECEAFSDARNKFLDKKFSYRLNTFKFYELMSSLKMKTPKWLCTFILTIYESVLESSLKIYFLCTFCLLSCTSDKIYHFNCMHCISGTNISLV